jgi:GTP-binding protein
MPFVFEAKATVKFVDEAEIELNAGHGGPGSVHFRRETMEPRGGPDGGDGGRGGHIYIRPDPNLATLMDFRFRKKYQAPHGEPGSGKKKAGKDGEDIVLRVPVGTIIRDAASNELLFELVDKDHEPVLMCKAGRGGKGNSHFATSTHQTPRFAQPGEEGETRTIKLELKLLADVGLVGFPNVGKSSLIAAISAARPKIADYAFTTLVPNLGVVRLDQERSFVVADVPGLIEGAHEGVGLGIRFLKHLERTRLYLHLIDAAVGRDPEEDYRIVRHELEAFNPDLLQRREVIVFNKMDSAQDNEALDKFCAKLDKEHHLYRKISVATREGVDELVQLVADMLFTNKYNIQEIPHR